MKRWMGWVLIAGLVAACDKKTEAPGASAPQPPAAAAPAKQAHKAEEPHEHAAPHGGLVESSSRGHVELVATHDGKYRVYLLDDALNLRPVEGASGSIKVAKAGYPDVTLAPAGDHLAGEGPAHTDEHLAMVVTVVQGGKPETLRFNAHLEKEGHGPEAGGMKEHDHTPLQGGIVAMNGDLHLEVLSLRSGEVRVWVTDAFRRPVSLAGMKGTVEAGGQSVPLTPEPGGQFLTAKLPASDQERETTVHLPLPGDPEYFITFLLTPKEAQAAAAPAPAHEAHAKAGAEAVQEVTITVAGGYQPSEVKLKKGVPARLRFIRKDTGGCSEELVIPDFGVKKTLVALSETVVEFTPDKAGTFAFTCGMGMMKGQLVVN
jgi:hypothetical protein